MKHLVPFLIRVSLLQREQEYMGIDRLEFYWPNMTWWWWWRQKTFAVEIYSWDIGRGNGIKSRGHMSISP